MPHLYSDTRDRVGMSTITFRFRPLQEALQLVADMGVREVDLGAIPDVTDHVPVPFTGSSDYYRELLGAFALRSGAVNSDVGDLNDPSLSREALARVAEPLIRLAAVTGGALIVPCGRASWEPFVGEAEDLACLDGNLRTLAQLCDEEGVRLLVEVLHHKRYVHSVDRANRVLESLGGDVFGLLFDIAHVVASSEDPVRWAEDVASRAERVHLRDAVPGDLNVGIGRGQADFPGTIAALEARGFRGSYILELETHDVEEQDREADAIRSLDLITEILAGVGAPRG